MKKWFPLFAFLLITPGLLKAGSLSFNEFKGLNTDDSPLTLQAGQTPDSENVVTDEGPGLQSRKGFIQYSTEPSSGLWEFPKSDGTRYLISKSSNTLKASTGDGTFSVLIATIPTDRITAVAVLGDRVYFANTLNGLKYWNGTTVTTADATMTVDKLVTHKGRLFAAGKAGSERIIFGSKYLDGTTWTLAVNPVETDPVQITVAGALDENIQALYSSFQDKLMWFKKNSFGAIFGDRRTNFTQRTFSDAVGVSSPETIRDCDGLLRWLGNNRVVWEFDGNTFKRISNDIDTILATVVQGDANTRSNTFTTQTDWDTGTQSPTGFADSAISPGSLTPKTTTFLDTTQANFLQGTISGNLSTSITADSIVPSSFTVTETSNADFALGTRSNLNITNNSLILATTTAQAFTNDALTGWTLGFGQRVSGGFNDGTCGTCALAGPTEGTFMADMPVNGVGLTATSKIELVDAATESSIVSNTHAFSTSCSWTAATLTPPTTWYYRSVKFRINGFGSPMVSPVFILAGPVSYSWFPLNNYVTCSDGWSIFVDNFSGGASTITAGSYISKSYDTGISTNLAIISSISTTIDDYNPILTLQASHDNSTWATIASGLTSTGTTSAVQGRRYLRYTSSFTVTGSSDPLTTLDSVTLVAIGSGTFTSRTFDTGMTPPIWGLTSVTTTTTGTGGALSFYTQTSNDGSSWDSRVAATHGSQITSATKRYLRYQFDLVPSATTNYATVQDVTLTGKSTGTYVTAAVNVGSNITAWAPITINDDTSSGGSISYEFSASNTPTFTVWNSISKTGTPAVAVKPYAAIRATYAVTVATQSPAINDITFGWTEGSTVRATSGFSNQRYWLGVAVSSTANNRILVYDKENQWQRYNGMNSDAMATYNSRLYFGNTNGTWLAESGYSDNGVAITSYYRTPTVAVNKLDLYSNLDYLYLTTDNSDATMTTSFQINGISTDYTMGSVAMNTTSGIQNFKLPFSNSEVQAGKYLNFKWQVVGTSFWRINNGTVYFQPSLIPE